MRRREFIAVLSGVAAWPLAAHAQAGRVYRLAWVSPATPVTEMNEFSGVRPYRAFLEELRRLGYVEGQNLILERYSGEGRIEHYGELAHTVVRMKPDLIFTIGLPMTLHFKSATTTIPIISLAADPVAGGLATSLAHPGANITGVSVDAGLEIWGKRLALLKETVPLLYRVGYLSTRNSWERPLTIAAATREAAQKLGIFLVAFLLEAPVHEAEYRRVFAAMSRDRPDALIVSDEAEQFTNRRIIVELADKIKLPSMYAWHELVELGGLMAYAYDLADLFRQAAGQIDQVLRGAKPEELPFHQATTFKLVINLKTAKALGLTVPAAILIGADEVIE